MNTYSTQLKQDHDNLMNTYSRKWVDFQYGEGSRLFDAEDRDYIDFGSGIGVNSLGYGNQRYIKALGEQISKLTHVSNLYANSLQARLAKRLTDLIGEGAVFFSNSGAEANECAIKIARKYGERKSRKCYEIITLKSSFHGRTIATLRANGQDKYHEHFYPFPDGFNVADDVNSIKDMLNDNVCGVMIELIQGEGGVRALDIKEVQDLARELRKREILLITDEVQSGVYRSGKFLASEVFGIQPDIVSLAKGLGGGIPIGATFTSLKDIFSPGDHGSTFGGNHLSMQAGLCVLDILEEWQRSGKLEETIKLFLSHLKTIVQNYPHLFASVSGMGLMLGLICKDSQIQEKVMNHALEQGVLVLKSGANVVRFLPPLLISHEEIEEGFKRLNIALKQI